MMILFDSDGVLADFETGVCTLIKHPPLQSGGNAIRFATYANGNLQYDIDPVAYVKDHLSTIGAE
ncbi:MAG: hypothetical protein GF398_17110 [Chitinivibrionales bacterium]|nr:hypothetical protein [Chitinivibrionales bacterium]